MNKHFKTYIFALIATLLGVSLQGFCQDARVLVVVPDPFVRNAIVLRLQLEGYHAIKEETCSNLDANCKALNALFANFKPDYVIVDGSKKNAADALFIDTQVVNAAWAHNVKKTLVLSSSEIYPTKTPLPFKEDALLDVKRETLTDPYTIAKITALQQCHEHNGLKLPRFIFCPYPYLAGPHDTGFVIRSENPVKNIATRVLKAKWKKEGFAVISNDGRARYELMHIDDLASAVVFLLTATTEDELINIAYGQDTNVKTIAEYTKSHLKFNGNLIYDPTSFDTVARLMLDNSRITTLGWYPTVVSQDIIKDTVLWLEGQQKLPYNASEDTPFILP